MKSASKLFTAVIGIKDRRIRHLEQELEVAQMQGRERSANNRRLVIEINSAIIRMSKIKSIIDSDPGSITKVNISEELRHMEDSLESAVNYPF